MLQRRGGDTKPVVKNADKDTVHEAKITISKDKAASTVIRNKNN